MKACNTVTLGVFIREDDDAERVRAAFHGLLGLDPAAEKVRVSERNATGFSERRITILECTLSKERHTASFLDRLLETLPEGQRRLLAEQKGSRTDDDCNFFIRLDKEALLKGEHVVTDGGNCFHIRMNLSVYPKRREKAYRLIEELFS
ncbi:hypothetical protein JXB02_03050 [Candidatus Woesearchaeota archaeon]|nr:hypothetical protein [Candidatus Woesearchaeota archaeon]